MPVYEHVCLTCGYRLEQFRPMAQYERRPRCIHGHGAMPQDLCAKRIAVAAFRPYAAASGGACAHEMEQAQRDAAGNWQLRMPDGRLRQLNPPGFDLHPQTGDVLISSSAERRRYMRACGLIDLSDFDDLRAENARRSAAAEQKAQRAMRRAARGAQAAARKPREAGPRRKTGWVADG